MLCLGFIVLAMLLLTSTALLSMLNAMLSPNKTCDKYRILRKMESPKETLVDMGI